MIEQVASNKPSLLLKNVLQNTQTLHLFTVKIKSRFYLQKLLKMLSRKAWVDRSIERG
jgi:hypothetical protein